MNMQGKSLVDYLVVTCDEIVDMSRLNWSSLSIKMALIFLVLFFLQSYA